MYKIIIVKMKIIIDILACTHTDNLAIKYNFPKLVLPSISSCTIVQKPTITLFTK